MADADKTEPNKGVTRRPFLPGDLQGKALIDRIVRVDHAGEYGAVRIYQGQMDVLRRRDPKAAATIEQMAKQEQTHLRHFEELIAAGRARPSLLHPLWHHAGYALGAVTALMGSKAAMACTVAVEEAIDDHYRAQVAAMPDSEAELRGKIETFRQDEKHHHDTALAAGAEQTPGYDILKTAIKAGARAAIWLAERL